MARPRLQKYAKGDIFVDFVHLAEATKITVRHTSGANDVNTMGKGRAGESPGVQSAMVTIATAVPVVGVELDFLDLLHKGQKVEIVVVAHGKKKTLEGFVRDLDEDYDVASPSAHNITISCGPAEQSTI